MRGAMLTRVAWVSGLVAVTYTADTTAQSLYDIEGSGAWIGALLETQWQLLDPLLGASVLVGTLLAGWNSHLRRQIGRRQRAELALRAAKQSAESANRAKSDFLATASHEIRTPLNAVAGMLELALKEAASNPDVKEHLRVAHGAAQALLELVGDILDLEKIDCGKLELLPEPANLRELAESVVKVFEGVARCKRLDLLFHADDESHAHVLLDAMRFKQVVSNLLSNALKFTSAGHVEVRVTAHRTDTARLAATVEVIDTGIGISPADQQNLFTPFTQTRDGARVFGGSGLGLSIARRLAALMGGTLRLEGAPGQGCTARFDFEAALLPAPPGGERRPAYTAARTRLQILAVDDNGPSRMLLRKQLERLGHRVVQAAGGNAAWRLWRPGAYDMVITDCNMAEGDGYTLARRIRRAEAACGRVRCIVWAYTAGGRQDEIHRCHEAGMDACLLKPLSLAELQRRLCEPPRKEAALHTVWRDGLRFDPSAIETLAGGDSAVAGRFLAELIEAHERDTATLRDALDAADIGATRDVLHALTGVARIIAATALADACVAAQEALGCETGTSTARCACRLVQAELDALLGSIRAWIETAPGTAAPPPDASQG